MTSSCEPNLSWHKYPEPLTLPAPVVHTPSLPLVSIVTPSYNQGQFIRDTIESVLEQEYPNIEYWVVDGGSNDETIEILREFESDPRFHWMSEPDGGQGDAVNKGWRRAQGEILGWLNSDDTYLPNAIAQQVNYLQTHPEVDVIYGDAVFIDADGNRIGKYWGRPFSQYEQIRTSCIPQPTAFIRRSMLDRNGTIDINLNFALDYEYWLRASLHSTIKYHRLEVATYRMHETSKTVADPTKFNPELERIILNFLKSENLSEELHANRNKLYADVLLRMAINYVKADKVQEGVAFFRKSLGYGLRLRSLLFCLYLCDPSSGKRYAQYINEKWSKRKSAS
ncbi:MAG: glycosyltransferase [Caldilineaceae bacterium]|nr:glycosyltransferase [Caldilineaceae bacterium]